MSAHDEAVEAAKAEFSRIWKTEKHPSGRHVADVSGAIAAYLRHMRAAGFVVTKVPEARSPDGSTAERYALDISWNAARAEMLSNAVEVPE